MTPPDASATAPEKADLVLTAGAQKAPGARDLAGTVADAAASRAAVAEARRRLEARAGTAAPPSNVDLPPATPPAPVREEIESIEIALPGGGSATLAKRHSVNYQLAVIFNGAPDAYVGLVDTAKALLSIREINGRAPPAIETAAQLRAWMDMLGDDAVDVIATAYRLHWPPLMMAELKVIKKKLKTPIS